MATSAKTAEQLTDSTAQGGCRAASAKPIADLQVLDLPQRVACEVISGAQQSISSIASDVKDGAQWVKNAVEGKVSQTELVTTLAASALVVGMAAGKSNPQAAEEAAEGAASWGQRAWQFVRGLVSFGSPSAIGGAAVRNPQLTEQDEREIAGLSQRVQFEQGLTVQARSLLDAYSQTPIAKRFGEVLVSSGGRGFREALSRAYFDGARTTIFADGASEERAREVGAELNGLLKTLAKDPRFADEVLSFTRHHEMNLSN